MKKILCYVKKENTILIFTEAVCCFMVFSYFGLNQVLEFGTSIPATVTSLLAYPALCWKIINTKYNKKELLVGCVLFALAGVSLYVRRDTTILTNVLVLLSLKNIDIDKLLGRLFWSALAASVLVMSCSTVGIGLPMSVTKLFREDRGIETRYCFGYGHPNPFHMYMVRLMCLFAGAFYKKLDWRHLLGLVGFNLLVFAFSDSRTGMIGGFALILLLMLYRYGGALVRSKGWNVLMVMGMAAIIAFGYLSVLLWGRIPALEVVNSFFTRRIEFSYEAWKEVGFSIWGRDLLGNYPCDNGMINMTITYGWAAAVVYWVGTVCLHIRALKEQRHYLVIILLIFALCTVMEASVSEKVFRNIPMIYMSLLIFGSSVSEVQSLSTEKTEEKEEKELG